MNDRVLQISQISRDEFRQDVADVISKIVGTKNCPPLEGVGGGHKITILNRKEAAKVLCISLNLFDKLVSKGIIPCTATVGTREMWTMHHILSIRNIIQGLKYTHSDQALIEAKYMVKNILGL